MPRDLRSMRLPPTLLIFRWRIANNGLPTAENLLARGVNIDRSCQLCNKEDESMSHFLTECEVTRGLIFGVRNYRSPDWQIRSPFEIISTVHRLLKYDSENAIKMILPLVFIWYRVWQIRNQV